LFFVGHIWLKISDISASFTRFFFFSDSEVVIIMSWGVPVVQFQSPLEAVLDSVPASDPFPWVPWAEIGAAGDPPSGKDGGW
jgi:hypothetical protein